MRVIICKGLLNLGEFGFHPRVLLVAVGMKPRKGFEALVLASMVEEPTGTLGE